MSYSGKQIAILGAGKSGLGAAKLARQLGATPVLFDSGNPEKLVKAVQDFAAEKCETVIGLENAKRVISEQTFDLAVTSPGLDVGWPLPQIFVAAGVPIIGEIEFAWQTLSNVPVVGITGTNGKTTTTELIERMFNRCGRRSIACGNYGHPLSEVAVSGETYDVLTVEMSSFQLETITSFQPKVAVWLNFAPDHLDRYPDEASYFAAKLRIFDYMAESDFAIVRAGETLGAIKPFVLTFTTEPNVEADFTLMNEKILFRGEVIADIHDLPLQERHNLENEMAALGVGWVMGLQFEAMIGALSGYGAGTHRCELVGVVNGRRYINDSKATNLHALETCLKSQNAPVVLIAGGKEKGLDYTPFRPLLKEKVTILITIGEIATKLITLFEDLVPCHRAADMDEAVKIATQVSQQGQTIVLSPGTSSFDMYNCGYAERGEAFRTAVNNLAQSPTNRQDTNL